MEMQDIETSSDVSNELNFSPSIKRYCKLEIVSSDELLSFTSSETHHDAFSFKSYSILSNTDSDNNMADINDNINLQDQEWIDPIGNQPELKPFMGTPGLKSFKGDLNKEENFYLLLVTEEIFQEIAEQTNLYAMQVLSRKQSSRLNQWVPTTKTEIKKLFGLIIWMGLVKLPQLHLYWSKDPVFAQTFPRSIMSRNRFELLLRMLHFTNNENVNLNDQLYKVRPIIDTLNENFTKYYDPSETVYIDEFVITFHSRITLKQYIKQKKYKYGIKICKLCFKPGYTYNFQIHCNKKSNKETTNPTNAIISLCKNIFDKGHTICTDHWYTSVELAQELITKNTHLVGMVQPNCQGISKKVITKKLKKGEIFAKENRIGITLMKWKDKRDVLLLSTKHSTEMVTIRRRKSNYVKPKLIFDYNEGKSPIDISDQMTCTSLHKNVKWYRKLAFELLLNTAVVNAWVMYNSTKNNSISMIEFKKRLVIYLSHCQDEGYENLSPKITVITRKRHEIKKKEGKLTSVRQRCISCYKENVKNFGTELARNKTKRVATYCADCPNEPHLCLTCFNKEHRNIPF